MQRIRGAIVIVTALLASASVSAAGAVVSGQGAPERSVDGSERSAAGGFRPPLGFPTPSYVQSDVQCTVVAASSPVPDVLLDCDAPRFPNNEPHLVVDPADPDHMVASSNDFDSNGDAFYVTFDGGGTWRNGDMSMLGPNRFGSDPVSAIDPVTGRVMHASLNFLFGRDGLDEGHVVVSVSGDGGLHWNKPRIVAKGRGDDDDRRQVFNDKEWMATDTDPSSPFYGRTYLVWAAFYAHKGRYRKSPIRMSYSDDGGKTWSAPLGISGSKPLCTKQRAGPTGKCDEAEFPTIAIAADGTVSVAFLTPQNKSAWEPKEKLDNSYFVVQSTDGGATWTDPVVAATLEDGSRDFPRNVFRRNTLTGWQLRIPTGGNIAADPVTGDLYVVWTDNRDGVHDVKNPVTDANVFITTSSDGISWTPPDAITLKTSDQWFPFVDVDPSGTIGVIYNDRRLSNPRQYDVRFAEGSIGAFSMTKLNSEHSDPVRSAVFVSRAKGCRRCSYFHGDYIALDYDSTGVAHLAWTDMRREVKFGGIEGTTENIRYLAVP